MVKYSKVAREKIYRKGTEKLADIFMKEISEVSYKRFPVYHIQLAVDFMIRKSRNAKLNKQELLQIINKNLMKKHSKALELILEDSREIGPDIIDGFKILSKKDAFVKLYKKVFVNGIEPK